MTQNHRKIVSFARRYGKTSTKSGKSFFAENIDKFRFDLNNISSKSILEIGFGMGDNLINLAKHYPDYTIYGAEPFIDGHIKVIRRCLEENIGNIKLFPDDVTNLNLDKYKGIFDQIYVLFPDPWPKKHHFKRRLLNTDSIPVLLSLVKESVNHPKLIIASDHPSYQEWIEEALQKLEIKYNRSTEFPEHYKPTKYHQKALKNNEKHYHPIFCYYVF